MFSISVHRVDEANTTVESLYGWYGSPVVEITDPETGASDATLFFSNIDNAIEWARTLENDLRALRKAGHSD